MHPLDSTRPFSPSRLWLSFVLLALGSVFITLSAHAAQSRHITLAAAADLHVALGELVGAYRHDHPDDQIEVVYGASGKLLTQIEQGAPFELFFSADSDYPQQLAAHGGAGAAPVPYALGHLVLWSARIDLQGITVADLAQSRFGRIAIANPQHAPYGKRAEQALRHAGVWDALQPRLVYGENIAQAAQYALSGNAQVGIIAQSLALDPKVKGSYVAVPVDAYETLQQSFVLTKRGADNPLAREFARYVQSAPARAILSRYGFALPGA